MYYPIDKNFFETFKTNKPIYKLFDLRHCESIDEFSTLNFTFPGRFSERYLYYDLINPNILVEGKPYDLGQRFNIKNKTWESRERSIQ